MSKNYLMLFLFCSFFKLEALNLHLWPKRKKTTSRILADNFSTPIHCLPGIEYLHHSTINNANFINQVLNPAKLWLNNVKLYHSKAIIEAFGPYLLFEPQNSLIVEYNVVDAQNNPYIFLSCYSLTERKCIISCSSQELANRPFVRDVTQQVFYTVLEKAKGSRISTPNNQPIKMFALDHNKCFCKKS